MTLGSSDHSVYWICMSPSISEYMTETSDAPSAWRSTHAMVAPSAAMRSALAWPIPEAYKSRRYGTLIHGVGLADEYPGIKHADDFAARGYDGLLAPIDEQLAVIRGEPLNK